MAEFPDFGAHCSVASCNLLDFLPTTCDSCKKPFCMSHCLNHGCQSADGRVISDDMAKKSMQLYAMCSTSGCFVKEFNLIKCGECTYNFCHQHRNPESHDCVLKPVPKPAPVVRQPAPSTSSAVRYSPIDPKAEPQSRLRAFGLMRHRMKLQKDYKLTIYFFIHVNADLFPIVVPENWTVNHALTAVLEQCNLASDLSNVQITSMNDKPFPDCDYIGDVIKDGDEVKLKF